MFKPPMTRIGVAPRTGAQIEESERRLKSLEALFRPLVASVVEPRVIETLRKGGAVFMRETVEECVESSNDEETRLLVLAWINTLFEADEAMGEGDPFDLGMLDDAMLPPEALTDIDEVLTGLIHPDDARAILRTVKASLPSGQVIPDDAKVVLAIEGMKFVPDARIEQHS